MSISADGLNHFDRLNKNLRLLKLRASSANKQFVELAHFPEVIKEQAYINYCVSSSTIPLLIEAIRCAKSLPADKLVVSLLSYYEKHIPEEEGHDLMSLRDYVRLGGDENYAEKRIPPNNLTAMIGSQYYLMRKHPVAFMGYLACLEVNHPTVEYVENLIQRSKLPREGFTSLLLHATVDIEHKKDIIETLNSLPLTEEQYNLIEMSAFQTYHYVSKVMEDVCRVSTRAEVTSIA